VEQANDRELDLIPPFRGCWRGQSSIISGLSDLDSLTFLFHIPICSIFYIRCTRRWHAEKPSSLLDFFLGLTVVTSLAASIIFCCCLGGMQKSFRSFF
jgi:hypothetical protein